MQMKHSVQWESFIIVYENDAFVGKLYLLMYLPQFLIDAHQKVCRNCFTNAKFTDYLNVLKYLNLPQIDGWQQLVSFCNIFDKLSTFDFYCVIIIYYFNPNIDGNFFNLSIYKFVFKKYQSFRQHSIYKMVNIIQFSQCILVLFIFCMAILMTMPTSINYIYFFLFINIFLDCVHIQYLYCIYLCIINSVKESL